MRILTLGEKIKKRRKELEMTLKDLAGDRITPGQISLVESGRSNPSMDLLEYLAEVLETSVEYLIESEETQAEKISIYYKKLAEYYILSNEYIIAQKYIDMALKYTEKYELKYRKAKILCLQAKINIINQEYELAREELIVAAEIFTKNNNYEDVINTFLILGKITLDLGLYSSSKSYFRQAEKVYIDSNIEKGYILGAIYYFMARSYLNTNDKEQASKYARLANEKLEKIHNKEEYAQGLIELSKKFDKNGDLVNSTKYAQEALDIYRDIQSNKGVSKIENSLGRLFYNLDDIQQSLKHYEIARGTNACEKDLDKVTTLIDICKNYIKLKDVNKCEQILVEIKKYMNSDDVEKIIEIKLLWYRVYLLKEIYSEAEHILLESYKLAKENNLNDKSRKLAMMLGKYYIDNKRDLEAAKYLEEGVSIYKECRLLTN